MVKNDVILNFRSQLNPSRPRYLRTLPWALVTAWVVLICILSSLPGPEISKLNVLDIWDKAAHFVAFATGAVLVSWALRVSTQWSWTKIGVAAVVATSIFGGVDEWHQLYTVKRSGADVLDWTADTLGALVAIVLSHYLYGRYQRRNCPSPAADPAP